MASAPNDFDRSFGALALDPVEEPVIRHDHQPGKGPMSGSDLAETRERRLPNFSEQRVDPSRTTLSEGCLYW